MKKLIIVLICMLLCGCSQQSNENTEVTKNSTTTPVATVSTTTTVTNTPPVIAGSKVTTTTVATTTTPVKTTTTTQVTTTAPVTTATTTSTSICSVATTPVTTTTIKPIEKGLIEKTSGDILSMTINQESFIVYLGTSYCPHCVEYKPHVEEFLKDYKDVAIYYVVLDKSDAAQTSELTSLVALEYTPTTFLIVNGGTQDSFVGTNDKKLAEMISVLK